MRTTGKTLTFLIASVVALLALLAAAVTPALAASTRHGNAEIARIRAATTQFHSFAAAEDAGYTVVVHDINGISCIAEPGMGAMGVHLLNPTLLADPSIDPTAPEALVYAPAPDGTLRLAALEYLVVQADWDATHTHAPALFRGHPFDQTAAPNRYGLPAFYSQHLWIFKHNPAGLLNMWNPRVHCPSAA